MSKDNDVTASDPADSSDSASVPAESDDSGDEYPLEAPSSEAPMNAGNTASTGKDRESFSSEPDASGE